MLDCESVEIYIQNGMNPTKSCLEKSDWERRNSEEGHGREKTKLLACRANRLQKRKKNTRPILVFPNPFSFEKIAFS